MRLLLLIIGVTFLDQFTKHLVRHALLLGDAIPLIRGLLDLRLVHNTGAAWGMLAGWRWLLIGFSCVMLTLILRRRQKFFGPIPCGNTALGLLSAGILGNLIDRIRLGYVVDFIDFYHGTWHFPAFNVADAAICIGVGLYLLGNVSRPREAENRSREDTILNDRNA